MADDTKNPQIDRQKRELIRRRAEVMKEIESLKADLQSAESKAPMQELNRLFQQEVERQNALKKDIEDAKKQLRDLRNQSRSIAERRNQLIEDIREGNLRRQEAMNVLKSSSSSDVDRDMARKQIEQIKEEQLVSRRDEAEQAAKIANYNTAISRQVGRVEASGAELSLSRRATRAVRTEMQDRGNRQSALGKAESKDSVLQLDMQDYERRQRERATSEADRFSPQALLNQVRRGQSPDAQLEALRAGSTLARAGGTGAEQNQIKQATQEFYGLFQTIKDTKKSLAELTEGTEEHTKKQEELTLLQGKAAETVAKIDKIEREVEKRKLSGGGDGGSFGSRAFGAAGAIARFGGEAFDRMGGMATERYVLEEQRKQAQLQLQNMALSDTRNRTRDATSFLSTGGGALFGAEMPFTRGGGVNGAIGRLGQDYANTREAVPQYKVAFDAMGGAFDLASQAAGDSARGAAINPLTGGFAGAGTLMSGGAQLGMKTFKDFMLTPELAGRMGGSAITGGVRDFNSAFGDTVGTGMKFVGGGAAEWGGGNRPMFEGGVDKLTGGATSMANALPNVLQRAYESVNQMNQLISSEQQAGQAGRVRERLSMAFAPGMQQYMDAQGSIGAATRSSNMSRAEREEYERRLEMSSLNSDLSDRGFGVNQILGNNAAASRTLGRFGSGGRSEGAASAAMMAEAMGLGESGQSIRAMGGMIQGGVKDPAAMMEKAMKEGLMKGLQDSRQFQGLLDAATQSADSAAGFEGTLNNMLKLSGSGRASDTMTAQAAFKSISNDMSGMSGTWTDMVKFDITNQAAKGVISGAASKGIDLTREDRTSLQNLANLKPEDLQNEDLVRNMLTPGAMKAIDANGGLKKFVQSMNTSMMVHGSMDRAINATQSQDLVKARDLLKKGDKEGLKKMFSGPGGRELLDKVLSQNLSGMSSTGDINAALGATQGVANEIGSAIGMDPQEMRLFQEKYSRKDLAKAKEESGAAGTMADQQARAQAQIEQQNMATAVAVGRDANGKNRIAGEMGRTGEMYGDQSANMIKNVKDMKTVEPQLEVQRIDQAVAEMVKGLKEMKDAFKDFSGKDFVVNASKDVVIQGASAIKGVVLDNGLTQAATEAGKAIAGVVKDALDIKTSAPGVGKTPASTKTTPNPMK